MDITYNEVVSFLEIVRPGGERLVDQLLIYEELTGKDLKTIIGEYLSNVNSSEVLYNSRESSLFEIISPQLKRLVKEMKDIEKETSELLA
jgi:hypothetical protein